MEITILEFIPDAKNFRVGKIDFTVKHSPEKSETFRNVGYFVKDKNKWVSLPMVERNGKWYPVYNRTPSLGDMLNEVTKAVASYLANNNTGAIPQNGSLFDR
jgi:hypothetical protein